MALTAACAVAGCTTAAAVTILPTLDSSSSLRYCFNLSVCGMVNIMCSKWFTAAFVDATCKQHSSTCTQSDHVTLTHPHKHLQQNSPP